MPRGFSEVERAALRNKLLGHAESQLIAVGLHKISVDELAQAAHISKGAFFQFFASKNELFVTLFGAAERELREKMRKSAMQVRPDPREQVRAFFHESLAIYRGSPSLRNFKRRDFEMLLHEASITQVAQAMGEDEAFYGEILEIWAQRGLKIACSPAQFSGLMRSIFVSTLYVADFGAAVDDAGPSRVDDPRALSVLGVPRVAGTYRDQHPRGQAQPAFQPEINRIHKLSVRRSQQRCSSHRELRGAAARR